MTYAPLVSLIAVVYSVMCTEPGEIFSGLYKWLENKLMARKMYLQRTATFDEGQKVTVDKFVFSKGEVIYFPYKKTLHDYEWIFKPIIGCERCVAGQMALWFYVFMCVFSGLDYFFFIHVALVSVAIYFSAIFKTIYLWLKAYQEKH